MSARIQLRRGLSVTWADSNPVLAAGEIGLETDTKKLKIGDGLTGWNTLAYLIKEDGYFALASHNHTGVYAPVLGADDHYVTNAEKTKLGNLSGTNTGDQINITGNAATASTLQTARNIDGISFNGSVNIEVLAPATHATTSKTTPVDADELPLVDTAASNGLKKLTWGNLKAAAKTYFDSLYYPITDPTYIWAGRPDPTTMTGKSIIITGFGRWYSDGVKWTKAEPFQFFNSNIRIVLPGSGYMGDNGAITFGTQPAGSLSFGAISGSGVTVTGTGTNFLAADVGRVIILDGGKIVTITARASTTSVTVTITGTLSTTSFANNAWWMGWPYSYNTASIVSSMFIYLPANAVSAGSTAGVYYCVLTSALTATVYNNLLATGLPQLSIPSSPTAFVTTGPGAFTQTTGSEITLASANLFGELIGANGTVWGSLVTCSSNNTAASKIVRIKYSTLPISAFTLTTCSIGSEGQFRMFNSGVTNRQLSLNHYYQSNSEGVGGYNPSFTAVSSSADQNITLTAQIPDGDSYCGFTSSFIYITHKD